MTFPKQAKLQGQKVEQRLPEPGTGGGFTSKRQDGALGVGSGIYPDPGGGRMTERTRQSSYSHPLKRMRFILYKLYLNKPEFKRKEYRTVIYKTYRPDFSKIQSLILKKEKKVGI